MNFGAVPVATNWLQNFNQITVSVKMHGINAQKAHYKCILLLPVKYPSWSGNEVLHPANGLTTPFSALVSTIWQRIGNIKLFIESIPNFV